MFNFSSVRAKNPPAQLGKCIEGVSGNRLLGTTVHRAGRRSVQWRAAPVACGGVALHGGLQTIVQYVAAESLKNREFVVHADPWVLYNSDVLGALKTALPGHEFLDLNKVPPRDGNIVIRPVTSADNVIKIVAPSPTKTTTFYQVNAMRMLGGDPGSDLDGGYSMDGNYSMEGGAPSLGSMPCRSGQCSTGGRRKKSKSRKRTSQRHRVTKKRTKRKSHKRSSKKRGGQAQFQL